VNADDCLEGVVRGLREEEETASAGRFLFPGPTGVWGGEFGGLGYGMEFEINFRGLGEILSFVAESPFSSFFEDMIEADTWSSTW
jgi:hypothetical protein